MLLSRQSYAGLALNAAQDVEVVNNYVKTESNEDFAYVSVSGSVLNTGSGNNKLCKVAPAAGTGFGLLSSPFENIVSTASWKECQNAKKSAWIFGKKIDNKFGIWTTISTSMFVRLSVVPSVQKKTFNGIWYKISWTILNLSQIII